MDLHLHFDQINFNSPTQKKENRPILKDGFLFCISKLIKFAVIYPLIYLH